MSKPPAGAREGATPEARAWLARVQHDLVKRMLWPARDRRDVGGAVVAGELVAALIDDEGAALEAEALWERLVEEAPSGIKAEALSAFAADLRRAGEAAARDDLEGVLGLAADFERLAQIVKSPR